MRQYKSAHAAWVKCLTQAAWADQSCHIEPAKMAENFFGGFILVQDHVVGRMPERNCS